MSFQDVTEYLQYVNTYKNRYPNQRLRQVMVNTLPNQVYSKVVGEHDNVITPSDPFYDDNLIPAFLVWVIAYLYAIPSPEWKGV